MAASDEINEGTLSSETVMARFVAERGDIFEEFHFMAREMPETVNLVRRTAGYVHYYENKTTADQELSGPMRDSSRSANCVRRATIVSPQIMSGVSTAWVSLTARCLRPQPA